MSIDASALSLPSAESTYRRVNGVRLHVLRAGRSDDPLVVLLHGFPDFFYGWRTQIQPLVEAGYRVLVPDQRGYNLSDAPAEIGAYRIETLSRDIVDLIRSAGESSAHVVGHDWGGMVAWDLALRHPEVVNRMAVINAPHPLAFRRTRWRDPRQVLRSWYALFFQLPRLPEWTFQRKDFRWAVRGLKGSAEQGSFTDLDVDRYRQSWSRDGRVTGMLNWYRAAGRYGLTPPREGVDAEAMVVWGEQDPALVPILGPRSVAYCGDGRLERFPTAGHWVHLDHPSAVSTLLVEHLDGY